MYWRQCGWSTIVLKNKAMSPFFVFLYKNKSFIPRWISWVCYLPLFTVTSFLLLQKLAEWAWVCSLPSCIPIPFCQKLKNGFSMHLSHVGIYLTAFLNSYRCQHRCQRVVRNMPNPFSPSEHSLTGIRRASRGEGAIAGLQHSGTIPSLILT